MKYFILCFFLSVVSLAVGQLEAISGILQPQSKGCPSYMSKNCEAVNGKCGWRAPSRDYKIYRWNYCGYTSGDVRCYCGHCWVRKCPTNRCCDLIKGRCSETSPGLGYRPLFQCQQGSRCRCWVKWISLEEIANAKAQIPSTCLAEVEEAESMTKG